ncbi:hypothetical protein QAD02_014649 [Eretmocerus hayati]|uniref:Uncharacterized protein n=1 Tax=Eretmocerus hayati TaxID=131215 RepID=A0ACC2P684_9HYME|nr:hypothetical protein QAD02_014649 [Eretmocerus hayati]
MIGAISKLTGLVPMCIRTAIQGKALCESENLNAFLPWRSLHLSCTSFVDPRNLRSKKRNAPKKDQGVAGESSTDISLGAQEDIFPDVHTPDRLFDGIPYKELPIINIKACKNNTILSLTDFKGFTHIYRSCGVEGFKTSKKGTNIAAQITAMTLCKKAMNLGVKTVRVRVQGLGPGRLSAIKGLEMGGQTIVSVTDHTHVSWNGPRPRKAKRV